MPTVIQSDTTTYCRIEFYRFGVNKARIYGYHGYSGHVVCSCFTSFPDNPKQQEMWNSFSPILGPHKELTANREDNSVCLNNFAAVLSGRMSEPTEKWFHCKHNIIQDCGHSCGFHTTTHQIGSAVQ